MKILSGEEIRDVSAAASSTSYKVGEAVGIATDVVVAVVIAIILD